MHSLDRPVVCPSLIGRDAHLAALDESLGLLATGQGQTLLVAGEAGIGKSRLVAEVRSRAGARGIVALDGHCFEAHQTVPYAPLIELLRAAVLRRRQDERRADVGPSLASPLAPELARLVPELATVPDGHAAPDRHQIFRALIDALHQFADGRPLLLTVEDAHWADDASLDFVAYLAHQLATAPILLVVTYRDDEVSPALSKLLAELDRRRLAAELRLARLWREEVAAAIQAIFALPRPVRPDFLDAIYTLTDGNPFYVEEVLRALIAAGDIDITQSDGALSHRTAGRLRIPRSVRDAVDRRTELLTPDASALLVTAAVVGQQFELELVAGVAGQDETRLLASVKELLAAGLVVDAGDDRFAFRHALTRAAVLDGLLTRERRALHRAVGETLEGVGAVPATDQDARIADLAHHFAEAAQWDRVLHYAPQAGARAQALYAPRAAVEQYTRALHAAEQLGAPKPLGLLRARGQAYQTLGDFEGARADLEAALAGAGASHDRRAEWQALFDLGAAWMGRSYERSGDYLRASLELARSLDPPDARALGQTLNALGNLHTNFDEADQALQYHHEALAQFRALDDRRGLAETLDFLGMASFLAGDVVSACARLQEAIGHFRALDHRHGLASALGTWAIASGGGHLGDLMVLPPADLGRPQREAEAALVIARESQWRVGEVYALNCVASTHASVGAYARAHAAALEALGIAEELGHREWIVYTHCTLGTLHLDLLALPEAQAHYDQAVALAPFTGSRYWTRLATALAALARIETGELAQAEALLDQIAGVSAPARTWAERGLQYARARLALAQGEAERALHLADELLAVDRNATEERPVRRARSLRGEALAALGRVDEARQSLLLVRRLAAEAQATPLLWRIDAHLAQLAARQGDREMAASVAASARAIVDELAAGMPDDAFRETFLLRAAERLPQPRAVSARVAAKQAAGGLTARERDVAILVARGLTNRDIADALVLGERTVQTHVSNILNKLGFSTRAQIAAWVADRGLLEDAPPA